MLQNANSNMEHKWNTVNERGWQLAQTSEIYQRRCNLSSRDQNHE